MSNLQTQPDQVTVVAGLPPILMLKLMHQIQMQRTHTWILSTPFALRSRLKSHLFFFSDSSLFHLFTVHCPRSDLSFWTLGLIVIIDLKSRSDLNCQSIHEKVSDFNEFGM